MTPRYVVLLAIDKESGHVWGGELVGPEGTEAAAFARLRREHPGRWIDRTECGSLAAAERVLGLTSTPAWLELLLWACAGLASLWLGLAIAYALGWIHR